MSTRRSRRAGLSSLHPEIQAVAAQMMRTGRDPEEDYPEGLIDYIRFGILYRTPRELQRAEWWISEIQRSTLHDPYRYAVASRNFGASRNSGASGNTSASRSGTDNRSLFRDDSDESPSPRPPIQILQRFHNLPEPGVGSSAFSESSESSESYTSDEIHEAINDFWLLDSDDEYEPDIPPLRRMLPPPHRSRYM